MPPDPQQLPLLFGTTAAPSAGRHEFFLGGVHISYTLKRSARRRGISLVIDDDGLRVGAPLRATQRRIEAVLVEHAGWIGRKLAEWQARRPPRAAWRSGARIMVLGEEWVLNCDPAQGRDGQFRGRRELAVDPALDSHEMHARVVQWLRDEALRCFIGRAAHYAPAFAVPMPRIRLSNAKTRWGTCHPDGRVHLNWRLIQMPLALVDYVVVHELAHLLHPNHSRSFWREVERVLPDYAERRQCLRHEGYRYLVA
jgi:predicted metal-dependent hydrolase